MIAPRSFSRRRITRRSTTPQHGFALIEALVGLLLFSLAALALVGLQTSMLRAQTGAKYRGDATFLAADLIGTMWADSPNLAKYSDCVNHPTCKAWQDRVSALLPLAGTTITPKGNGQWEISITWEVPSEGEHKFSTSATITPNPKS